MSRRPPKFSVTLKHSMVQKQQGLKPHAIPTQTGDTYEAVRPPKSWGPSKSSHPSQGWMEGSLASRPQHMLPLKLEPSSL